MEKEIINVEGIEIEIEKYHKKDSDAVRRKIAYIFKAIREESGMSRTEFSEWLGVPYRTMQEWELGRRKMPEYVLRLIAYKVANEKQKGKIGRNNQSRLASESCAPDSGLLQQTNSCPNPCASSRSV